MKRFFVFIAVVCMMLVSGCSSPMGNTLKSVVTTPTPTPLPSSTSASIATATASPTKQATVPTPTPTTKPEPKEIVVNSAKLGLTFSLPKSWKGKYRIEESKDSLSVYFKPSKPVDEIYDGFLFFIARKTSDMNGDFIDNYREFKVNGTTYVFGGPTDVTYEGPEDDTFLSMNQDALAIYSTIRGL